MPIYRITCLSQMGNTGLDGQKVATVIDLIVLLRQELRVGQEIDVEVFRGDSRETLRLTLGERPQ